MFTSFIGIASPIAVNFGIFYIVLSLSPRVRIFGLAHRLFTFMEYVKTFRVDFAVFNLNCISQFADS